MSGANLTSTVGVYNWEPSLSGVTATTQFCAYVAEAFSLHCNMKQDYSCTQLLTTALSQEGRAHSAKGIAGSGQNSLKHTYIMVQARLAFPEIKFLDWRPRFPELQQA